ncbi:hypothetical protein B9G69_005425 [Bdellovibrio sp. SKB1291214]|uniref:hypothetical protein n=1 Tax=Bdellovibrio sp. SKB1291214 TaxID=1732569 RepID=UPI000B51A314|nr:hypothetical protein [Bdellovibrio sp. SKB1291214]UYL10016.1 hypothetical protein B9G69_005425 [Bdellovibrio sp. SKB1291214]
MKLSHRIFIFVSALFCVCAHAKTELPRNLSDMDQIRTLEILGYGTASKVLGDPYPLGGYSGVELGVSTQFIPVSDLSNLGNKTEDNGELSYYTLTLGKGLYYNIDAFVYFTPSLQSEEMQNFGGQLRWGFYEASFFPISFSALLYAGGANFQNLVNITTTGWDVIGTVNMENVAVYFGAGRVRAQGNFIGGPGGITASGQTEAHDISENHTFFGVNVEISKAFIALEVDRYTDSVYGGKLGYRF